MALPIRRCLSRLRALTLPWPAVAYHAKPLKLNLTGFFLPDPEDPKTKDWHKGPAFEAKLYGRYGSKSGVNPEQLWPRPVQLKAQEEEEKEWYPSLQEMLDNVRAKDDELRKKQLQRERLIAANMKKMPQLVEEWRKGKREARQKAREENANKERLLMVARAKFGVSVNVHSPKFLEMVKEIEKEEKRKLKAVKRLQREEEQAAISKVLSMAAAAKAPTTPDSSSAA